MKALLPLLALAASLILPASAEPINGATQEQRISAFAQFCASVEPPATKEARQAMIYLAARIYAGKDTEKSLQKWQEIAESVYQSSKARLDANPNDNNARNPFEKHALIHSYVICRDKAVIPQATVDAIKRYVSLYKHRAWFGYGALNYRLMNDGAGFIAAEIWPDLRDADGLDSAGIKAATKTRLLGYFDDIAHHNTDEYGAPTYLGIDLSAMKLLADYAKDPEVKQRATLTLDSMILHVACAWNNGYYTTPASRAKGWGVCTSCPEHLDTTAGIGWLYFGGLRPVDPAHMNPGGAFWFSIVHDYRPPALFASVANERGTAFTHRGSVRENIRFTIRHEPGYSLANECALLKAPSDGHYKESRRSLLKWVSDKPESTFAPLQDNPERPYRLQDKRANKFGYGENPFTQSLQNEETLIGISNVPEDYPFWKSYAPFTTEGAIVKRQEKNGWVFCHGGSVLFAFRYLQPAAWTPHNARERCDVLRSESRKNGWVLETSPVAPFAGGGVDAELARFADAVIAKTKLDGDGITAAVPRFSYQSLTGHTLEIAYRAHNEPYSNQHKIDGTPVNYNSFPLFENPWVQQALNGDALTIQFKGQTLTYDFKNWTRTQKP